MVKRASAFNNIDSKRDAQRQSCGDIALIGDALNISISITQRIMYRASTRYRLMSLCGDNGARKIK